MRFSGFVLAGVLGVFSCLGSVSAYADNTVDPDVVSLQQQDADQPGQHANVAELGAVKQAFEARFEGLEATTVRATPVAGLYEVQVGMDLIYVDAPVNYVFQGSLVDANTRVDLTAARLQKLSEVPFESLPLQHAVKIVRGDGSRKLAVFEDPNCIYCKRLHASLNEIENTTLYSFLFPILSSDSIAKARNIWCADNPPTTLQAWMLNGTVPAQAQCDDDPVEQVLVLGRELMVRGTPAILFADGTRVNGTLPTEQLSAKLDTLN